MYEQFSLPSRFILGKAQRYSRAQGLDEAGPIHIFLAVISTMPTSEVFAARGLTPSSVVPLLQSRSESSPYPDLGCWDMPEHAHRWNKWAKRVLEMSLRERLAGRIRQIEPSHIAMAVIHPKSQLPSSVSNGLSYEGFSLRRGLLGLLAEADYPAPNWPDEISD